MRKTKPKKTWKPDISAEVAEFIGDNIQGVPVRYENSKDKSFSGLSLPWKITPEFWEDNLNIEEVVKDMFLPKALSDLSRLIRHGDRDSNDRLLRALDGLDKLGLDGSNSEVVIGPSFFKKRRAKDENGYDDYLMTFHVKLVPTTV